MFRRIFLPSREFSVTRRFYAVNALQPDHYSQLLTALESETPVDAYDLLVKYRQRQEVIPKQAMWKFYEAAKSAKSPFLTYLFSSLVTVDQVGQESFQVNVNRAIKLHLQLRNWESCLKFLHEVELANDGQVPLKYDTLEALLLSAKWHGDVDTAVQVVQAMLEVHSKVYSRNWGILMQLALDKQDYECLRWVHKTALVPGFLVLDDASYLRMARLASKNGDLRLCEWSALRMTRRQRAMSLISPYQSIELYTCLIEAAAKSSLVHQDNRHAPSIRAVCRYIFRLDSAAAKVNLSSLPQTVDTVTKSDDNHQYVKEVFEVMLDDPLASRAVKTLLFNVLLSAGLRLSDDDATHLDQVFDLTRQGASRDIDLNEDSILLLLDLARKNNNAEEAIMSIAARCPSSRVIKKVQRLGVDAVGL